MLHLMSSIIFANIHVLLNSSCYTATNMFSKKKKKPAISLPSNFQHRVHTGYDNSSNKFVGLPKQWASLVEDVAGSSSPRRPQPVIDPSTITPTDMLDLKVTILSNFFEGSY